jgi:hypothetical protein
MNTGVPDVPSTLRAPAARPLKSALKKSAHAIQPALQATQLSATSNLLEFSTPNASSNAAPGAMTPAAATVAANSASSASTVEQDLRIRHAAEEKATQLHQTRRAQEQWSQWVMQVQLKLMGQAGDGISATARGASIHATSPAALSTSVTAATMQRARHVLTPSEFDEVLEERVAARLCAYPTCAHLLPEMSSEAGRKYKLSLKAQRVYDVEEGQRFCSQECFLQSEIYRKTLSDEPWHMRQQSMQKSMERKRGTVQQTPHPSEPERKEQPTPQSVDLHASVHPSNATVSSTSTADPRAITQLLIVEKPSAGVPQPPRPTQTSAPDATTAAVAAKAAAFAVEGYEVQHAANVVTSALLSPPTATAAPSASAVAPLAPSVHFSDSPATAATGRPEVTASAPTATIPQSTLAHSSPSVPSSLTSSEFDALSEEQRINYLEQVSSMERLRLDQPPDTSAPVLASSSNSAAAEATLSTPPVPSADVRTSSEKKIKRRKSAAEKTASASALAAEDNSASSVGLSAPSKVGASSPSRPSPPVSAASAALMADDATAGPMITPSEMQENLRSIRAAAATMPPFVLLLQVVLRWSTEYTQAWLLRGALGGPPVHPQSHARQTAFHGLVQQHWPPMLAAMGLRGLDVARELQELVMTLAFDQALPALSSQQWAAVAMVALKACAFRRARAEKLLSSDVHTHSWRSLQCFSTLAADLPPSRTDSASVGVSASQRPPASSASCSVCVASTPVALSTAVQQFLQAMGFTLEQMDSLYHTLADGGWVQPR